MSKLSTSPCYFSDSGCKDLESDYSITPSHIQIILQFMKPSSEQLQGLSTVERWIYHASDYCNRTIKVPFMWWNAAFMYALIWFGLSKRLTVKGLENVSDLNEHSSVLIASNHRTFFDFFVVTWINFDRTRLSRRIFFPVRSNFFYDNPLGFALNFIMGGCAMFPPVFRDERKKGFNKYSVNRVIHELNSAGTTIGFHPEGKRNSNPDPYSFLPAKPGIGFVVKECPNTYVIPVFIVGMSNNYFKEVYLNWTNPNEHPITVYYGAALQWPADTDAQSIASETLDAIQSLAVSHKSNR